MKEIFIAETLKDGERVKILKANRGDTLYVPDRKAVVCKSRFSHPQKWTEVKRIRTKRGTEIVFCHSDGCEICSSLPKWEKRVREWVTEHGIDGNDVLSVEIRVNKKSPREVAEYLLLGESRTPWSRQWAREFLDGKRDDPPRANLDVRIDKEVQVGGKAVDVIRAIERGR